MNRRISSSNVLVALIICLAMTWSVACSADVLATMDSTITSSTGYYSDALHVTVSFANGIYHYEYVLDYQHGYLNPSTLTEYPLTTFSVGNTKNYMFMNAGCDNAEVANPTWGVTSNNSVLWLSANGVMTGTTVKFWYDSYNPYQQVNITLQGGRNASGKTLGMMAPEPTMIVSLGIGLAGLGGALFRKRSKA